MKALPTQSANQPPFHILKSKGLPLQTFRLMSCIPKVQKATYLAYLYKFLLSYTEWSLCSYLQLQRLHWFVACKLMACEKPRYTSQVELSLVLWNVSHCRHSIFDRPQDLDVTVWTLGDYPCLCSFGIPGGLGSHALPQDLRTRSFSVWFHTKHLCFALERQGRACSQYPPTTGSG